MRRKKQKSHSPSSRQRYHRNNRRKRHRFFNWLCSLFNSRPDIDFTAEENMFIGERRNDIVYAEQRVADIGVSRTTKRNGIRLGIY